MPAGFSASFLPGLKKVISRLLWNTLHRATKSGCAKSLRKFYVFAQKELKITNTALGAGVNTHLAWKD
jgi:hypothetical protein